jgi:hypothetical protein
METYIVRIYRHGNSSLKKLVGLVEVPGNEERMGFTDLDELWTILSHERNGGVEKRKKSCSGNEDVGGR